MGIPKFARHSESKHSEIVIGEKIENVDSLYLDLNCAIHPCSHRVIERGYKSHQKEHVEDVIGRETVEYIDTLVNIVKPNRLLFISVDGVAPRAKMSQQRSRRFKSINEKKRKSQIEPDDENDSWDSNSITPGTPFMSGLSQKLINYIKERKNDLLKPLTIIFSDCNQPGEGEHKILAHLRNDSLVKGNVVVYGLDADLIMLSMVSHVNNIYLLREASEFGKQYMEAGFRFCYWDIDTFKYYLIEDIEKVMRIPIGDQLQKIKAIDDYVFMCFLLGNDFIPHLPAVLINENGIELLLEAYATVYQMLSKNLRVDGVGKTRRLEDTYQYQYQNLICLDKEHPTVNFTFLTKLIEFLSKHEDQTMLKLESKRNRLESNLVSNLSVPDHNMSSSNIRPNRYQDPNRIKKYKSEVERQLDILHNYPIFHRQEEQLIDINNQDGAWIDRYYYYAFRVEPTKENINQICRQYLQGLMWVLTYYYEGCSAWGWYYPYHHAPTAKHLTEYLMIPSNWHNLKPTASPPYKPYEQLMIVLPPESRGLLPESYRDLMVKIDSPLIEYYPLDYQLDTIYRRFYWECPPILSLVDDNHLRKTLRKHKLTKEEIKRNAPSQGYLSLPDEKFR